MFVWHSRINFFKSVNIIYNHDISSSFIKLIQRNLNSFIILPYNFFYINNYN